MTDAQEPTESRLEPLWRGWRLMMSMLLGVAVLGMAVVKFVTMIMDTYRTDALVYFFVCFVVLALLWLTTGAIPALKRGQRPWTDPFTWLVLCVLLGGNFAVTRTFDQMVAYGMIESPNVVRARDEQRARLDRQILAAEIAAARQPEQRAAAAKGLFVQLGSANGITILRDTKTGCEWIVGADGHPVKRERKDGQGREIWVCDQEGAS